MKPKHLQFLTLVVLSTVTPATADVIYSNLQNIEIPVTFDGLYLNVETGAWNTPSDLGAGVAGWDVNPFFGGRAFANSPDFQPVRSGEASDSPILKLAEGTTVGSGSLFFSTFVQGAGGETPGGPGYGGSQMLTGSGGNFTADTEGYLGFRLNGTNYGWMRVVLTNNTGGAMIKEWAYDNSGAAIGVANVKRSGSTVTLNSSTGPFTISSAITDSSGTTHLEKTASGTATLTGSNDYSGTTTVSNGTLLVNGSNTGSGLVTVAAAATLGGTGSIAGALNVTGMLAPGGSIESFSSGALTMNTGSTFAYEASPSDPNVADLMTVNGALSLTDVSLNLAGASLSLNTWDVGDKLTLISYKDTGTGITGGFTGYNDDTEYTFGLNQWLFNYNDTAKGDNFTLDATGDHFVTLTLVPEPRAALLGLLGTLALLRRRRA